MHEPAAATTAPPALAGVPDDLASAFWRYDRALLENDLDTLDELFVRADDTVRIDASGSLVGWEAIAAFRRARPARATRVVTAVHATRLDPDRFVLTADTSTADRGPGAQSQVWQLTREGWKVRAAHVSATAAPVDPATWRVRAHPLSAPVSTGPLDGETVAVKDLFAVAGHRTGGGVPLALAGSPIADRHADAVQALLGAGASVIGITQCDEFAFGLEGTNPHSGTSRNARAGDRMPGGSSSGCASAVAAGEATIGLASDTAGSVRVPASYQGLWGLRATHGLVSVGGMLALAPSFDAVGWLARSPWLIERILDVHGVPEGPGTTSPPLVFDPRLARCASESTRAAFETSISGLSPEPVSIAGTPEEFERWYGAFRARQAFEAWVERGPWITAHPGALSASVEARFRVGASIDSERAARALAIVVEARARIADALAERVLVLPTAHDVAPLIGRSDTVHRDETLRLGALAAIGGLPAVSAPLLSVDAMPVGITFFAASGNDRAALAAARGLGAELRAEEEATHAAAA